MYDLTKTYTLKCIFSMQYAKLASRNGTSRTDIWYNIWTLSTNLTRADFVALAKLTH